MIAPNVICEKDAAVYERQKSEAGLGNISDKDPLKRTKKIAVKPKHVNIPYKIC